MKSVNETYLDWNCNWATCEMKWVYISTNQKLKICILSKPVLGNGCLTAFGYLRGLSVKIGLCRIWWPLTEGIRHIPDGILLFFDHIRYFPTIFYIFQNQTPITQRHIHIQAIWHSACDTSRAFLWWNYYPTIRQHEFGNERHFSASHLGLAILYVLRSGYGGERV